MGDWTIFSNHGHVLVCLANNNQARLRDVAAAVGITERAVQNILRELQDSGLVQVSKHGRCNHYQINTRKSLRHPLEAHCTVGQLLQLLKSEPANATAKAEPAKAETAEAGAGAKVSAVAVAPKAKEETLRSSREKPESSKTGKPEQKPEQKSEQKPEQKAEQKPEQKPEQKSEQKPEKKPDTQQGSLF